MAELTDERLAELRAMAEHYAGEADVRCAVPPADLLALLEEIARLRAEKSELVEALEPFGRGVLTERMAGRIATCLLEDRQWRERMSAHRMLGEQANQSPFGTVALAILGDLEDEARKMAEAADHG